MVFQLGAQLMDAMVLAIIAKEDAYGYSISQQMKHITNMRESTLYPILRRLQQNGYLTTYDQPFQGRNRKYYTLTEEGKRQYYYFVQEWNKYKEEVEVIIKGGIEHE